MHNAPAAGDSIAKSHRRFPLTVSPNAILSVGAVLLGSLLAIFGSLLLQMLRTAGR